MDDVNVDSLLLKFFNWTDLQNLRKMNKSISSLADIEIINRFKHKEVIFQQYEEFYEAENDISIGNTTIAVTLLNDFGPFFRKISFQYMGPIFTSQGVNTIYELVEKQCSDTIIELKAFHNGIGFFNTITKPFKSVESVILDGDYAVLDLGNDQLNFSEIFPALRRLAIGYIKAKDANKIILHYPHLEYLNVKIQIFPVLEMFMNERIVMDFIRKNVQIQSLELTDVSENLLKIIADEMPMLKQLKLHNYNHSSDFHFHFEHIKSFSIQPISDIWLDYITFSNKLEEFESEGDYYRKYVTFIEQHRHFKRIKMIRLNNLELKFLESANFEAIDLELTLDESVEAETIYEFIKNSKHFKRLKLFFGSTGLRLRNGDEISADDLKEFLLKEFSNECNIYLRGRYSEIVHVEQKKTPN